MKKITVHLKNVGKDHFRFSGIASSESRDAYGEIIKQRGINTSLVKQGKVIVNAEHEDAVIGRIETAEVRQNQLYVEGIVYLKNPKAKKFYNLLLEQNPHKPVTLSIEFVNPKHFAKDRSILSEVILTGVALVGLEAEPANSDTYVELLKSVTRDQLIQELIRRSENSDAFKERLNALLNRKIMQPGRP